MDIKKQYPETNVFNPSRKFVPFIKTIKQNSEKNIANVLFFKKPSTTSILIVSIVVLVKAIKLINNIN